MKEKDGSNSEDILAQLSNSRTSEGILKSLFLKLNGDTLTNVQRVRVLKLVILHVSKDGCTSELQSTALRSGLSIVKGDSPTSSNPASGVTYNFFEVCYTMVKNYVIKPNEQETDKVALALEILSCMNSMTASKLFNDESEVFVDLLVCLKNDKLKLPALTLLDVCLSEPALKSTAKDEIFFQAVYPLLFNLEDSKIRSAAHSVLQKTSMKSKTQPLWNQLKDDTQRIYCKHMVEMVNQKLNWPEIWQFVVKMFGEELHSGGQLINHMLEVLERAFKHSDFEWTRVQAFVCWNTLIDNFKSGLKNKKRIDLIMIPLKANNHRIEILASAKLDTYNHLLNSLGKDLSTYPDVLSSFFSFCFGSEKVTCPPVKSYPSLHEKCVNSISNTFASPLIKDVFNKIHKELIQAVGECFMLENVKSELLSSLWDSLMGLVCQQEGTDTVKELFNMINNLVNRAATGETSANYKMRRNISPPGSPQGQISVNRDLGSRIVLIMINGIIQGRFALSTTLFRNRSLYIGSFDVMNGTPPLLFVEWLLSPALKCGAANTSLYRQLMAKIISFSKDESTRFMDFIQQVLKKLLVVDESCSAEDKVLMYKCAADNWCTLANEVVEYLQNQGSINQGDAAEHDFRGLYSVLVYPVQNLHVEFELVEKCGQPWKILFYESCQQAALIATSSIQQLCEEVCCRLVSFSKRSSSPKQNASILYFFTNILNVALGRFSSNKRVKWVLEHISGVVKELNDLSFSHELVFSQTAICLQLCLQHSSVTKEVVNNVSSTLCSLLNVKLTNPEHIDELCSALGSLKQASVTIHQHGMPEDAVSSMLHNVIVAGKTHSSLKVRTSIRQLTSFSDGKTSPEKEKSISHVNGSALASRLSSPKSVSKKLTTIQMSPTSLSPGNSKKKIQVTTCGSDAKFVRIETPPKKIILTEHQKEVRRERRQDIPALYQDLSQASQSMTQDITLDTSPKKKLTNIAINEDAVMDTDDVEANLRAMFSKAGDSPISSKKSKMQSESNSNVHSFTPPSGFVLPITTENASKPVINGLNTEKKNEGSTGKENENSSTPSRADKSATKTTRAITRSSSQTNLTTRSGKVVKRASLSLASEPDPLKKKKSARKSLPVISSEDIPKKNSAETALESDTTDTESTSSVTSDTSGSGPKSGKMQGVNRRRSLKRQSSQELLSDSEKRVSDIKKLPDAAENSKEKDDDLSPVDKSKKSTQDLPLKKIGGKVLTRSRSNSSLDELVNEVSGTDAQKRAMSPIAEADDLKSLDKSSPQLPKPNGLDVSVQNKDSVESRAEDEITADAVHNTRSKPASPVRTTNTSSPPTLKLTSKESPKPSKVPESPQNVQLSTGKKTEVKSPSSSKQQAADTVVKSELVDSQDESDISERYSQESQEVIESSQEPMSKMKQCVVSLELFRCAEPNEQLELEDVIVESGPDSASPFKVLQKKEVSPTAQKLVCRSLNMDDVDSLPLSVLKKRISTSDGNTSPVKELECIPSCVDNPVDTALSPKKALTDSASTAKETSKPIDQSEDKGQGLAPQGEPVSSSWNSSMPEWMHEKKSSPPNKALRTVRATSSRSQAFLKSVSPPKMTDMSPISSPVQSKRVPKNDSSSNTTPIIKRSSRAAQLLGLGQAAAARGGDTVVSNGSRSNRSEAEETEIAVAAPSSSSGCNSNNVTSLIPTSATSTSVNTVSAVASPSVRRQVRLEIVTPQKTLEDEGLKQDWVRKTPCATATPDSSILKRKREVDSDIPSPSLKRKRVSFRDPPLSSILRFGETTETPGTVFSSDLCLNLDKAHEEQLAGQEQEKPEKMLEGDVALQSVDKASFSAKSKKSQTNLDMSGQETCSTDMHLREKVALENDVDSDTPRDRPVNSISVISCAEKDPGPRSLSPDKSKSNKKTNSSKNSNEDSTSTSEEGGISIPTEVEDSDSESMEVDDGSQSQGKCLENNSEQVEAGTEGMLDDLPHLSSGLSPVYPNLVMCIHSVECIASKLTAPVWKKALLREFSEQSICTIGDLAKLTQERLDRLSVKPPKRTNVCSVLEDFEKRHETLRDGVMCELSKDCQQTTMNHIPENNLKDALANASVDEIVEKLSELGRIPSLCSLVLKESEPSDIAKNIASNKAVLQALPVDIIAETYISQVGKSSGRVEKNMSVEGLALILSRVQAGVLQDTVFPAVPSILSSVHSEAMRNYVLREFSPSEIVQEMDNNKICQLLDAVSARLGAEELASKVLTRLNEEDIAKSIEESKIKSTVKALLSKLDFHESLKVLFDYGQNILKNK